MQPNDSDRVDFLRGIGLSPNAPSLGDAPEVQTPVQTEDAPKKAKKKAKAKKAKAPKAQVAEDTPTRVTNAHDLHTMDPEQVRLVLSEDMVAQFDVTTVAGRRDASAYLFSLCRSPQRGQRNKDVHKVISDFLARLNVREATDGHVREIVKTTADERALAQVLAAEGLSAADLVAMIRSHKEAQA